MKPLAKTVTRWCIVSRTSKKSIDGATAFILWDCDRTLTFYTRREAQEYIEQQFGYQRTRPDLRAAPHGCLMPKAVKCRVTVETLP